MQTTTKLNRLFVYYTNPHRVLLACVATAILMAATNTSVAGAEKSAKPHPGATKPAHSARLMTSTDTNLVLLLQEEDFWVIQDEPVNHLARATEALNKRDPKSAASELRKAAFFVKAHAARAEGAAKSDLQAGAAKLENLAGRVEHGVVKSQDELANALARTYLNLARYHYLTAVKEQAKDDVQAVKRDMTTAAGYVERHLQSAGAAIDQATQTVLADARRAGQSVESAAGKGEARTGRALESLGRKIQELGRKLASNRDQQAP